MRKSEKGQTRIKNRRIKAASRDTEEWFRRMFEQASLGMAISDKTFHFIAANPAFCAMLGFTEAELSKLTFKDITHPDHLAQDTESIQKLTRGEIQSYKTEKRYLTKSGDVVDGALTVTALHNDSGNHVQSLVVLENITQRKHLEEALQVSEQHYKMISELTTDYVYKLGVSADGKVFMDFVSDNYYSITGRTKADTLTVESWSSIIHPDDIEDLMKLLKQLIVKPQSNDVECRSYVHGRKLRWINVICRSEWNDKENRVTSIVGAVKDITRRKKAEEAVAAEKERLAVTLRSIGDAVIATDVHGTIVLMNKVAEDLTGWQMAETIGKPLSEVFNVIDEQTRGPIESPVDKVLSSGKIIELANHTLLISYDGTERVIADSGAPIKDNENKILGVVLVFRDITEKQKLLDTIQRTARLDSLGVLAGGIAHDFNNLLAGIYGYMDLVRCASKDPQLTEYIETILATMNRAKALTHQLLTFAKGGSPVQKITPLMPFLKETVQFALSGSNISFRFGEMESLWQCNIDKNQIAQVIDNIVINAQQAMPGGGAIEITAVNISLGEKEHPPLVKGDFVKVSIKDFGIGIPKEIMPRIFDPFYTTKSKGHGLGLATCHSIITRHGGCIDVESEPGRGSTFHFYLPASSETTTAAMAADSRHKGSGVIIVMDDEEVVRNTFRQMLELLGYTVIGKNSGNEVIDLFRSETSKSRFVAMILDLTVAGGMGGMETAREIRKVDKEIPIFVASGYADNSVMKNPATFGFTASISKPFTLAELSKLLNNYL